MDTLGASADLSITKTDGVTTATPGGSGSGTYTITASNAGPSNATGGTVTDTFPASETCTWTCAGAGSVTINIVASINANASGQITNQGTINYDSDGNGSNDATAVTDDPSRPGTTDGTGFAVVVGAGPSVPVPALDRLAMLLMLLGLAGLAWRRHATR